MHASISLVGFNQPNPEAGRNDSVGGAQPPQSAALGRHRSREVAELAPVLTVESFERPISKALCTTAGNPELESSNFQLEGEIVLNKRARSKGTLSTTTYIPGHNWIDDGRRCIRCVGLPVWTPISKIAV